jgi:hypothetical protein
MTLSYPQSPLNPCYKRKAFQVEEYLLTFDFGEYKTGSPDGTLATTRLWVTYVVHHFDKQGNFTGCAFGGRKAQTVSTFVEGEQLFEAANEMDAAAFLADHLKVLAYSQTKNLLGMLGRWLVRLPLLWRWQLRKWKRHSE